MHDTTETATVRPVIDARNVAVSLDETRILHDISFEVGRGRLVGLLGPNGSGKTTLLRALSGLLPFDGDVLFEGRCISDWSSRNLAQRLAFVRQSVSLSFDFNVSELVLLGRSPHKGWLSDFTTHDRSLMAEALDRVDLAGFENRSVLSLSGGELQRVFLAQALVQEADVLLLDEPTAHLDVHYQFEFMELVKELIAGGYTAVAVFHDLEMAARFADQLVVLQQGRIATSGPPNAVLTQDLIARVFRMDARVLPETGGTYRIQYRRPIDRRDSIG
ncbi:MAG: ABC transporter ATP-binding protein [Rhodothermales bacterium]